MKISGALHFSKRIAKNKVRKSLAEGATDALAIRKTLWQYAIQLVTFMRSESKRTLWEGTRNEGSILNSERKRPLKEGLGKIQ
jgi:hypothetical protein